MKKGLKTTLIVLGVLIGIIALDTLQAKIFDNSPLLKIRDNLDGGSTDYMDKGLFVNHYKCNQEEITTFKNTKYACSFSVKPKKFDFYISKDDNHDTIKFNDYFTVADRKIYLANNIREFYVVDGETMILKSYISNANQTMDDSIKKLTDKLDYFDILKDGGTTIYKSKDKDITMITCKTIVGNKDIYIGNYSTNYKQNMCI